MHFDARAVCRHTLTTWLAFTVITFIAAVVAVFFSVSDLGVRVNSVMYTTITVSVVSFILCWVFAPIAWWAGRALRHATTAVSTAAFGVLGFVVSAILSMTLPGITLHPLTLAICAVAGACCAFGRWSTERACSRVLPRSAHEEQLPPVGDELAQSRQV
ncbi:hypothetical protein [Microbacterium sp. 77mftsu3.1]|uniref:hypothetical protein n=1 Tax=Microbacterium sp. 77mftsu3.1 TaxID=1761802 RepID=UPI00037DD3E9|nr:hypothetical protein [Microbacterium sp. 77mftsu3.1]SDH54348.1 hypothetical protein SAMN04488590_3528 [Microbacterium sp. 77mftsu3.1]